MKKILILLFSIVTFLTFGQIRTLEIDGISQPVTFIDKGVDFSKTFVITNSTFKPWENALMLAGIDVGSFYYDSKKNSNICSSDYVVDFNVIPTWTGTITITELRTKKVVGTIMLRKNNWRFFHMPKRKHTAIQAKMLVAIKSL